MIRLGTILMFIFSLLPTSVLAIEISEIAWMGSAASANHEWIELYAPETIDVTGWSITDNNNLLITLDGVIDGGTFAVLERTSDASAPGTAWQIYTGSLVNTGATIVLIDDTGAVIDRVIGGEDWSLIGGDNETKATAQLTSSGWVTGSPTPGTAPSQTQTVTASADDTTTNETSTTQTTKTSSSASSERTVLTLPDITLQLAITAPSTVYVNQPVSMKVTPSGVGDTIAQSLTYTWNVGDGDTRTGQEITHAYSHPGNYVVVVAGEYKRQQQFVRHELVVLPVLVEIDQLPNGDVAVVNNSQTEINLAGYRLVGNHSFTFPDYTILLPRSQIVIPQAKFSTLRTPQMVALYDQAQEHVANHLPPSMTFARETTVTPRPTPRISAIDDSPRYAFAQPAEKRIDITKSGTTSATVARPIPTQVAAVAGAPLPADWPRYAFVGILLLAIAAVYLIPRREKPEHPWSP